MKENYNSVKVCPYRGDTNLHILSQYNDKADNYVTTYTGYCDLKLEPDLIQ